MTIFEARSGGLFIPLEAGVRPGNFVTIPNQVVRRDSNPHILPEKFSSILYDGAPTDDEFHVRPPEAAPFSWRGALYGVDSIARVLSNKRYTPPTLDARMREVYTAAYALEDDTWREITAPTVGSPQDVARPATAEHRHWAGAGNGFAAYPTLGSHLALTGIDIALHPTAQAIGELALPRLLAGEGVQAADALPLYVRHRVALTTAERDAGVRL